MTRSLPPCMYFKSGSYYLVKKNKWTRLAKTLPAALRAYAMAIDCFGGMDEIINDVLDEAAKKCAPNTMKTYQRAATAIKKAFAEFSPDQVTSPVVAQFLHAHRDTPNLANQYRSFLKITFNRAVLLGLAKTNPVIVVPQMKVKTRDRYITREEFDAIKQHATPELSVVMDLCYQTGQRIGDILKIKRSDLTDEGIYFQQQKTKAKLIVGWSPELREAVEKGKNLSGSVKGFTLLASGKGKPFVHDTIHRHWTDACKAAGVEDAHIHDLRAAAGTDALAAGQDSKALLGHKSDSSHQKYLRSKIIPVVEPVKRNAS
jgi:integrase